MHKDSASFMHILFDYIERLVSKHCNTTLFRHRDVRNFPQLKAVQESFRGINTTAPHIYDVYQQQDLCERMTQKYSPRCYLPAVISFLFHMRPSFIRFFCFIYFFFESGRFLL